MNDQSTSNEKQGIEAEAPQPTEPAEQPSARRLLPATAAGRTRLAAAGIATAFLLGGGLAGFAIGQANDGPDRPDMSWHDGFVGRGPGGGRH